MLSLHRCAFCDLVQPYISNVLDRCARGTRIRRRHHRKIAALRVRAYRLTQGDRRVSKTSLAREIADARSFAQCDAKPASGNLHAAQAGAAQSIPAAERNRNHSVARSSIRILPQMQPKGSQRSARCSAIPSPCCHFADKSLSDRDTLGRRDMLCQAPLYLNVARRAGGWRSPTADLPSYCE